MYGIINSEKIKSFVVWSFLLMCTSAIVYLAFTYEKWILLSISAVPVLLFISIKKPFFFPFGLYVFFLPFDTLLSVTGNAEGATLTKILGIITIAVLFIKGIITKKLKVPNFSIIMWCLFVLYGIFSIVWAIQPDKVIGSISTVLGLLLLYVIVSISEIKANEFLTIKRTIIAGGLIASIFAIYIYSTGVFYKDVANRASLIIGQRAMDPNIFALTLLIPVSICMEMMFKNSPLIRKIPYIFILFTMLTGIIFTGSRGGFLGIAIIFIVYALKSKQRLFLIFATTSLALIIATILPDIFTARWELAVENGGAGRMSIWYVGIHSLEKYWLFGAGLSNFPQAFNEFSQYAPVFVGWDRAAHSLYLGMLVELGLCGFLLMIFAIIKHYRLININNDSPLNEQIMLKAAFWGILVSSIFLASYWLKSFWLIWMLIMMHRNVLNSQKSEAENRYSEPSNNLRQLSPVAISLN